jgi:trk system potassium uptake protein TrkA
MTKKFLVIGLGRFGSAVAHELQALRQDVLAVDVSMEVVQAHAETLRHVVQLDATDQMALRGLDIPQFDICLVARGSSLEDSVLILMHLKELGAKCIIAKALTTVQARILETLGADKIVFPERDMGIHIARLLVEPEVLNFIPLGGDYRVEHVLLPSQRDGTRVRDLERHSQVRILAVWREGKVQVNPPPEQELREYDELVILGPNKMLARLHAEHAGRS